MVAHIGVKWNHFLIWSLEQELVLIHMDVHGAAAARGNSGWLVVIDDIEGVETVLGVREAFIGVVALG